jgi:hypothetical protein
MNTEDLMASGNDSKQKIFVVGGVAFTEQTAFYKKLKAFVDKWSGEHKKTEVIEFLLEKGLSVVEAELKDL